MFTSALVEGLESGDADRDQDGLVALDELYDYVYDKVRAATPLQTPGKWTFGVHGELVIARRAQPVATPAPLPPELQEAADSSLAGVRAAAVQELARLLHSKHAGRALAAQLALNGSPKTTAAPSPPRPLRRSARRNSHRHRHGLSCRPRRLISGGSPNTPGLLSAASGSAMLVEAASTCGRRPRQAGSNSAKKTTNSSSPWTQQR